MCTTCGCGADEVRIGHTHSHGSTGHGHDHGHHAHDHDHDHAHGHDHDHSHDHSHAHAVPSGKSTRLIQVERDLLDENNRLAGANRAFFQQNGMLALNLVSSPGSGKTTLLVRSLELLRGRVPLAVIEGDQETENDAARVRATGVPAIQVNTGKGCHLDALMISRCFERMAAPRGGVLFIENVGNLVCPAGFDLGEAHKVVVASVTEGEDKPLKYPNMFAAADLLLVSKCDLLPYLRFDVDALEANARRVNPRIEVIRISAETGLGLAEWVSWIERERAGLSRVLLSDTVRGAPGAAMHR